MTPTANEVVSVLTGGGLWGVVTLLIGGPARRKAEKLADEKQQSDGRAAAAELELKRLADTREGRKTEFDFMDRTVTRQESIIDQNSRRLETQAGQITGMLELLSQQGEKIVSLDEKLMLLGREKHELVEKLAQSEVARAASDAAKVLADAARKVAEARAADAERRAADVERENAALREGNRLLERRAELLAEQSDALQKAFDLALAASDQANRDIRAVVCPPESEQL